MHITDVFRRQMAWCPNHHAPSTRPISDNSTIHLVLIACLLVVPVSVLLVAAGSTHGDAVWIFSRDSTGTAHFVQRVVAPSFVTGTVSPETGKTLASVLPGGNCFMVVQHPQPDGTFDIVLDGNWVLDRQVSPPGITGGTKLFSMYGPGSLQGDDAYEALVEAIKNPPMFITGNA